MSGLEIALRNLKPRCWGNQRPTGLWDGATLLPSVSTFPNIEFCPLPPYQLRHFDSVPHTHECFFYQKTNCFGVKRSLFQTKSTGLTTDEASVAAPRGQASQPSWRVLGSHGLAEWPGSVAVRSCGRIPFVDPSDKIKIIRFYLELKT